MNQLVLRRVHYEPLLLPDPVNLECLLTCKDNCCCCCLLTLLSPAGASGSVIHDPNLDPDVLMVIGSEIPVSFPQAENNE